MKTTRLSVCRLDVEDTLQACQQLNDDEAAAVTLCTRRFVEGLGTRGNLLPSPLSTPSHSSPSRSLSSSSSPSKTGSPVRGGRVDTRALERGVAEWLRKEEQLEGVLRDELEDGLEGLRRDMDARRKVESLAHFISACHS